METYYGPPAAHKSKISVSRIGMSIRSRSEKGIYVDWHTVKIYSLRENIHMRHIRIHALIHTIQSSKQKHRRQKPVFK